MAFNVKKHFTESGKSVAKTMSDPVGTATDMRDNNGVPMNTVPMKDMKTATSTAGGSMSNAWKTSVNDPLNKLGKKAEGLWNAGTAAGDPQGLNIPKVGGGVGGAGAGGPTGPVQIGAIQGGMGGGDAGFRGGQLTLAQQLAAQAAGTGPSVAGEQLKQSAAANQAATFAQLASARGGANPALARQAMQTSAQIQGQASKDAALARLQEQMNAQNTLGAVLNTGRTGDENLQMKQAELGQQFEELKQKYSQQGQNAEIANQLASIEMEKILAGTPAPVSPMMQGLGQASQLISSIYGR